MAAAHSLRQDAVTRLREMDGLSPMLPLPLVLSGATEAMDYVPNMSKLGKKLVRRCWPGPVTLSFSLNGDLGLLSELPAATHQAVTPNNRVRLRVPVHPAIQEILRRLPAPLVVAGETDVSTSPAAATAEEAAERFSPVAAMIVADGSCRYGEPSTVVGVSGNSWELMAPGVVSEVMVGRLASEVILFVCTGNTCRSPMAESLFRKLLAQRLKCTQDQLFDRGCLVISAGLAAVSGAPASSEAIDVMADIGVDLSQHSSQPLTERLLDQADRIYTMTRNHRDSILAIRTDLADRVEMLAPT